VEPIRRWIEGFLRGRYGYEGYRAFRVLAVPVLIGAILVAGWLLLGPLLTIPRISSTGPVVRNGVAAVMVCGEKRGIEGMLKATTYAPEPRTGTWAPVRKGGCTVWYHYPPDATQRIARPLKNSRKSICRILGADARKRCSIGSGVDISNVDSIMLAIIGGK
jgi:hypothetical protein